MKRPRRRAAGKGPPPTRRPGEPFPKPRPRPRSVRPILGLSRNHAAAAEVADLSPSATSPGSRTILAAVGFFTILGVTLAVRAAAAELNHHTPRAGTSAVLLAGVMLLGIGARLAMAGRRRPAETIRAAQPAAPRAPGDFDAAAFTGLAVAVGALVAAAAATEPLRAAVTSRLDVPPVVLLALALAPLLATAALAACVGAHVIGIASAWFDASGRRVLAAGVVAGIAGAVMPLGRQGVLIAAPLALFVVALIVLLRHPAARIAAPASSPSLPAPRRPGEWGRNLLIAGVVTVLVGGVLGRPLPGPSSLAGGGGAYGAGPLPELAARRWEVRQAIVGAASIAESDLHAMETPTLLVLGGEDVADDDAPLFAARLARASRSVGRILFEHPCNQRLVRRVRRDLRRGGEDPLAFVIRFQDGAQAYSFIAVGFDIPAWLDARPLPSEYHLEFGRLDAPGPSGGE